MFSVAFSGIIIRPNSEFPTNYIINRTTITRRVARQRKQRVDQSCDSRKGGSRCPELSPYCIGNGRTKLLDWTGLDWQAWITRTCHSMIMQNSAQCTVPASQVHCRWFESQPVLLEMRRPYL